MEDLEKCVPTLLLGKCLLCKRFHCTLEDYFEKYPNYFEQCMNGKYQKYIPVKLDEI
jgi:hypothetical protein